LKTVISIVVLLHKFSKYHARVVILTGPATSEKKWHYALEPTKEVPLWHTVPLPIGVILGGTRGSGPPTFWRVGDGPPTSWNNWKMQNSNCKLRHCKRQIKMN